MLGEALEMVTQGLEIPIIDLNSVAIITDVSTTNTSPNVFGMTLDLVVIFKEMGIDGSVLPPHITAVKYITFADFLDCFLLSEISHRGSDFEV